MYTKCVDCGRIGKTCTGPDFYLLSAEELIAWCKRRKEFLHLSNAKIAESACMSRGTVDNLFAGTHADYRYESIRPILKVLIGKTDIEEMCATVDNAEIERLQAEIAIAGAESERLKAVIANAENENAKLKAESERLRAENEYMKSALQHEREQNEHSVEYMREQMKAMQVLVKTRKHIIYFLFFALVIVLCAIIGVLIWDKLNPDIGYFRGFNNLFGRDVNTIL